MADTEVADSGKPEKTFRKWKLGLQRSEMGVKLIRACLSEMFGTAFLIIICVGSANSRVLTSLSGTNTQPLYYLSIAISSGLFIAGIIHILGDSSGGHVNPAVTFALFLDKRISLIRTLFYITFQFLGGFIGAGILYGLGNHSALKIISAGNSYDLSTINHTQAFFLEALGTLFLVLTVLASSSEKRGESPSYLQPLSIGISFLVINIWLIPYTNCGINPVRGSVWNVVIGQAGVQTGVFLVAPFAGAAAAVPLFKFVLRPC